MGRREAAFVTRESDAPLKPDLLTRLHLVDGDLRHS